MEKLSDAKINLTKEMLESFIQKACNHHKILNNLAQAFPSRNHEIGNVVSTLQHIIGPNPSHEYIHQNGERILKRSHDLIKSIVNDVYNINKALTKKAKLFKMAVALSKEDKRDHQGVGAIILDTQGRIMMQFHNKMNFWTIPIGKVKPGDSLISTVKIEMKEECNINVQSAIEVASFESLKAFDGQEVRSDNHIFLVTKYNGEVRNMEPNKHREMKFMTIDEIKKLTPISDATRSVVNNWERVKSFIRQGQ